jgi:hypothetical protein
VAKIGLVMGKSGKTVRDICCKSGAYCHILDRSAPKGAKYKSIEIRGSHGAIERVKEMIGEKIRGVHRLSGPDGPSGPRQRSQAHGHSGPRQCSPVHTLSGPNRPSGPRQHFPTHKSVDQMDLVDPDNALKLMDPPIPDNVPQLVDQADHMDPGVLIGFHNINHIFHHLNRYKLHNLLINNIRLQCDNLLPP